VLRLLLDEHISPAVVTALAANCPQLTTVALRDWHDGAFLSADDATILRAAFDEGLTLVTYDLHTIPLLLKEWAEQGTAHGGMIFVHRRTVRPSDVGGLARALAALWAAQGATDWTDRAVFLQP
jgi:hypothetical protein